MMEIRRVRIAGTGMYVPPRVVTNHDLEKLMDTSDEWIRQRSGIETRHHVDPGVGSAELAVAAAEKALADAKVAPSDIDLIIVATLSPDHFFPGTSVFVQDRLGLETTPAMDLRCQCSGFLYALNVGQSLIATGQYEKILIIGTEAHSPVLDMTTRGRDVAVLFGDGAGAAVLEPSPDRERGVLSVHLHAEGKHAERLWLPRPGTRGPNWINQADLDEGAIFPKMEGRFVFKHAVTRLVEAVNEVLTANHLSVDDVDHFLFHQANLRINEYVAGVLGIPMTKVHNNIQKYGNCSAASIPILLDECVREGKFASGDLICMAAFGSGFTWGSTLVRW